MKKNTTKEAIIRQSAELFNIYGYYGCSINQIMKATGLKKGGIYNHFTSKDAIAVEAFNFSYSKVLSRFRERLDKDTTSYDKIISVIDVFVSFIDDPMVRGGGCPLFNTAMDATHTHPELKEKAREGIRELKTYIEIKLREGIEAGEFKPEIMPEEISTLLIAMLEGAIIMSRVEGDKRAVNLAAQFLKQFLNREIKVSPSKKLSK